jgi:hypothetical protein
MMTKTLQFAALTLIGAGAAAAVLYPPLASADEANLPAAGSESASATVDDIAAAGYTASLNWVQGAPTVPLSECSVTELDAAAAPTVFVTIDCPK